MKTHPLTSLLVKARWARRRSVRRRAMSDQTDKLQTKLQRAAVAKVEEEKKEEEETPQEEEKATEPIKEEPEKVVVKEEEPASELVFDLPLIPKKRMTGSTLLR